jgi:lipopolysaccharide biosynthesis regulator YciM
VNNFRHLAPGDLEALRMENELLTHEVLHLRARLKDADRDWQQKMKIAKTTAKKEKAQTARQIAQLEQRTAELQQAKDDIRWLLNRLDKSFFGPVMRHRPGFRNLLARHLADSES